MVALLVLRCAGLVKELKTPLARCAESTIFQTRQMRKINDRSESYPVVTSQLKIVPVQPGARASYIFLCHHTQNYKRFRMIPIMIFQSFRAQNFRGGAPVRPGVS